MEDIIKLIGHLDQLNAFRSFMPDKLSRSFMIVGPKECGKTFFVKRLAEEILGSDKVWRDIHPDFFFIPFSTQWSQVVEEFQAAVFKQPFESKFIVIVLEDADKLNVIALNKFLKNIEEPPAKTCIILTGSSFSAFPDTVASRCFKFQLNQRTYEDKAEVLFDHGIRDAERRLAFSSSLKDCLSPGFEGQMERITKARKAYSDIIAIAEKNFVQAVNTMAAMFDDKSSLDSPADFIRDVSLMQGEASFFKIGCEEIIASLEGNNSVYLAAVSLVRIGLPDTFVVPE